MTERPMLFDSRSVSGILDGSITQTRRAMKPQPRPGVRGDGTQIGTQRGQLGSPYSVWESKHAGVIPLTEDCFYRVYRACPYGQMGDRLWGREAFALFKGDLFYRADGTNNVRIEEATGWKPSIHMSHELSRILLEITGVRVERVQDIARLDAKAEGFLPGLNGLEKFNGRSYGNAQLAFQASWDFINDNRGYGWDANPWVWVIEFKLVTDA